MPVIATLFQRTVTPTLSQPVGYSLALQNTYGTAVNVTSIQPFVQVPAGVNTSIITNASGQIVAQAAALPAAMFPIIVPANSTVTVPLQVLFTTPLLGPNYQLSAQIQCSDGTGAAPPGIAITPSFVGPATGQVPTQLVVLAPVGQQEFASPTTSFIPAWA